MKPPTQSQNALNASEFFEGKPDKIRVRKCELSTSNFTTRGAPKTVLERQFFKEDEIFFGEARHPKRCCSVQLPASKMAFRQASAITPIHGMMPIISNPLTVRSALDSSDTLDGRPGAFSAGSSKYINLTIRR